MTARETLPINVVVEGRDVACLGACGEIAAKLSRLRAAGARITVVAEGEPHADVARAASEGWIRLERRAPAEDDAATAFVTFVSPDLEALGARLAERARAERRLVCTLDRPSASTFANPAVARGASLSVAISSGGRSPALLRRLREDLEVALAEPRLAAFVERLAALRAAAPPGARSSVGRAAAAGFRALLRFELPAWFEAGREGPPPGDDGGAA